MDERILQNVQKMASMGASEAEIDQYLRTEGVSPKQVRTAFEKKRSTAKTGIDTDSSFLGAVGQGATFGFSDELLAGGRALFMGQDYDKALQAERDALQRYRAESPVAAGVGELGGGIATAFIPGVGQLGNAARGVDMAAQMGRAALGGAAYGALAGAGTAEGGMGSRLTGAAQGALLGAPLGAAAPAVMAGARAGGSKALDVLGLRSARGMEGRADELLAQALARDGVPTEEIAARLSAAQAAGKPLGIIDVAGQNTLGLGRAASAVPSSTKEQAYRSLMERAEGAPERISADLQKAMDVGETSYLDMFDSITQKLRTSSKPLYDQAYRAGAAIDDPEILRYLAPDSPLKSFLPRAWKEAQDQASLEGETLTNPFKRTITGSGDDAIETLELNGTVSLKHMDYLKRALDDIIMQERGNKARLLRNVKNDLVDKLKERYPEYRQALAKYRGDIEMREALEAGRSIMNEASDLTARQLQKLSDPEKQMFRIGATTAIRDAINTARDRVDVVKRIFGSPEQRAKLKAVFPSESAYKAFENAMSMESRAAGTKAAITSGSRTTPMAQEINDMGINPSLLADFAMSPGSAIPRAMMSEVLKNRLQGVHGAVAESLNNRLFNFNPAQQQGVLQAMGQTQQKMAADQVARQVQRQQIARGLGTLPGLFME